MENQPANPPPPGDYSQPAPLPVPTPKNFPVGIILILILTGFGILGGLIGLVNPQVMFGPVLIGGVAGFLFHALQLTIYITLFVWLLKRKEKGRLLGIALSAYNMLFSAFTFLTFALQPDEMMANFDTVMPGYSDLISIKLLTFILGVSTLLNWMFGVAIILYFIFKKHHFRP